MSNDVKVMSFNISDKASDVSLLQGMSCLLQAIYAGCFYGLPASESKIIFGLSLGIKKLNFSN